MAKAGMRRPSPKEPHGTESNRKTHIPKNDAPPVPELQVSKRAARKKRNQREHPFQKCPSRVGGCFYKIIDIQAYCVYTGTVLKA